ncbi:hypothetical protein [Nocardioides sp.]|uniref:hypothetical protein n=1 Tax=Nocardioides sp. TaxID=35761 RepID=UPI002B278E20|nr:hypothetical protein [Nocardioides sp.]
MSGTVRARVLLAAAVGSLALGCTSTDSASTGATPAADENGAGLSTRVGSEPAPLPDTVFSVLGPWNTFADDRGVHPRSTGLLREVALGLRPGEDALLIQTWGRSVPVVTDGEPTVVRCRQARCGDGAGELLLDLPTDVDPDPRYDGWYTVVDVAERTVRDLRRARREDDGSISYELMREWDLDGPGFQQPYGVGARGSGLPLLGGLIRRDELDRGAVEHALAISLPGTASGSFLQPASSTDGTGAASSLPQGARIYLRPAFRLTRPVDPATGRPQEWTPEVQLRAMLLVRALKTYGAVVVDEAPVPTLYAERTEAGQAPLLGGDELSGIGLDDFLVVDFDPEDRLAYPADDLTDEPTDGPTDGPTDDGDTR